MNNTESRTPAITTPKTCLVTGASSGIGHAAALDLLRAGYTVSGVARRVEKMADRRAAGGHVLAMNITSETDNQGVVNTMLDVAGAGLAPSV